MITKEQILEAEGEELERLLGEVLQPGKREHRLAGDTSYDRKVNCDICGLTIYDVDDIDSDMGWRKDVGECDIRSISLTWPNAMKWRDWAVNKYGTVNYMTAISDLFHDIESNIKNGTYPSRFITLSQPEHYLKAAAICEIGAE